MQSKTKTKQEIKRDMLLSFIEATKRVSEVSRQTQKLATSHEGLTIAFKDGRKAAQEATRALNRLRHTGVRRRN